MNNFYKNVIVISLLVVALVVRLSNVLPNFSPVVAMSLLGAALLSRKLTALALPLLFVYISDFIINNTVARPFFPDHEGLVFWDDYMIWSLAAYVAIVGLGFLVLRNKVKPIPIVLTTLASSVIFFILTNIGSWAAPTSLYSDGLMGIIESMVAGLPFFRTSLLSDLCFSGVLFGAYFIVLKPFNTPARERA